MTSTKIRFYIYSIDFLKKLSRFLKILFLISLFLTFNYNGFAQSFAINLGGEELSLINANRSLISGTDRAKGAVYRYDNLVTTAGITVYGKLTIVDMSNATIATLDDETAGTGTAARFQPTINTSAADGYVSFQLEFFELLTNENVYISNYYMTGVDVDGGGLEFYEISGYSSYIVDATTLLTITPSSILSNGTRFKGGPDLTGITFDNTCAFIAKFPHPATKINFVMGTTSAWTSAARQFSCQFGSMGGTFSTIETQYNPNPVLVIGKTATPTIFSPGSNSQYNITVANG